MIELNIYYKILPLLIIKTASAIYNEPMSVRNILDVYIRPRGKLFQLTNDKNGITQLVKILTEIKPELIVFEATGGMELTTTIELT